MLVLVEPSPESGLLGLLWRLANTVREIAARSGRSVAELVRDAIRKFVLRPQAFGSGAWIALAVPFISGVAASTLVLPLPGNPVSIVAGTEFGAPLMRGGIGENSPWRNRKPIISV